MQKHAKELSCALFYSLSPSLSLSLSLAEKIFEKHDRRTQTQVNLIKLIKKTSKLLLPRAERRIRS